MMALSDLIPYGVGVVGSVLAMSEVILARRGGTYGHGVRLLASGLVCWSMGVAMRDPVPLIGDVANILGSFFLLATLTYIDASTGDVGRQVVRQAAVAGAVVGVIIAVYLTVLVLPVGTSEVELVDLAVSLCRLVALGCMAFTMVKILAYVRRLHRGDAFPMLLNGLRVTIAGVAVIGLAWATCELVEVCASAGKMATAATIANYLACSAILMACVGGAITRRASVWVRRRHRTRTRRSLDAVTPLWTLLVKVIPDIVLTWDDEERGDDVDVLCRRVIEIRDAQLWLRSYVTSEMQAMLEGILSCDHSWKRITRPIWEAAELTASIAAAIDGRQKNATAASPLERGYDRDWSLGYRDLIAEAEWLGQVAQAMRDPRMQAIRRLTSRH